MNTSTEPRSVETELAVINTKLDLVLVDHATRLGAQDKRLGVVELQTNTHEVKIADLQTRSLGMFSKAMLIVGAALSAVGILSGWIL